MLVRIAIAVCVSALVAAPAAAQQMNINPARCLPHDEMLKHLSSQHHEKPVAVGVGDNGALLELFATADGATWTALDRKSTRLNSSHT